MLFFSAGGVRESFGTLRMDRIRGLARSLHQTSGALVVGSLAIAGMPPFGLFVSEFLILTAAFLQRRYLIAGLMLVAISVAFGALLYHLQHMLTGESAKLPAKPRLLLSESAVMAVCAAILLALGVHIPAAFTDLLHRAMAVLQS
jgi:hydrogenase-4 component F